MVTQAHFTQGPASCPATLHGDSTGCSGRNATSSGLVFSIGCNSKQLLVSNGLKSCLGLWVGSVKVGAQNQGSRSGIPSGTPKPNGLYTLPFANINSSQVASANRKQPASQALTPEQQQLLQELREDDLPYTGHSELQLWLQDQLAKLPIFGAWVPRAREMAAANAQAKASADSTAASTRAKETKPASQSQKQSKEISKPKPIAAEDKPLWDMFQEMDANNDGTVDIYELNSALARLGIPCSPLYMLSVMKQHEANERETISWEEFRHYVHLRDREIEAAFKEFDSDNNGEISAREIGQVMSAAGLPTTGKDIRRLMELLDKDHNDTVSYEEFRRFACMLPSWQVEGGRSSLMYAGWMHSTSASATAAAVSRRRAAAAVNDPLKHFVVFDIMLRGSLAASLAVMVVMMLNQM
mmetsp:Transcript_19590/g.42503  ORF Transcript_19590/g.42503 Transcript_19590/m.42503 type:complete len:412 (+) Transcript_19590:207-1442(+)